MSNPPEILPVNASGPRPFWSVMIPTYRPDPRYLRETLQSVLQQDPGPDQMQIEVVDDCSPDVDVELLVRSITGDRITMSKTPQNLGLAGCWNTCIERSWGEWVHILHQDDLVLPGFYETLRSRISANSEARAAFCRHAQCDEDGHWLCISQLHRNQPGILENFLEALGVRQLIETPSIVVIRSCYEQLGGFRNDLSFTLDWEMWLRIASHFSFLFEPNIMALFRVHQISETSRLVQEAEDVRDIIKMLEITEFYQKPCHAPTITALAKKGYAQLAFSKARRLLVEGNHNSAIKQIREAFRLSQSPSLYWNSFSFFVLWARLKGAKIKYSIRSLMKV